MVSGFLFCAARFEDLNATVRWTVACRQLDGGNTIIFIPSGMKMLANLASSSRDIHNAGSTCVGFKVLFQQ